MAPSPRARPTSGTRAAAPARPAVRDLTGGASLSVEWDVRPVHDFVFSLADDVGATEDILEPDRRWLSDSRAALPEDVRRLHRELFGSEVALQVAVFAVDRPAIRTAAQLVEALRQASPREIVASVFSAATDEPRVGHLVERSLDGDPEALTEIAGQLSEWRRDERLGALRDPEGTASGIRKVLEAWLPRFETVEERVTAMLVRDHQARAGDRATLAGPDLVEKTTGGIRWLPEPGIRRIILAPSYFSRPYNILFGGDGYRLFAYPIGDAALDDVDPLAPPQSLVRLNRALGDETRLRILKLLSEKDLYLTEIAQLLELSKPTIKHHLALLRAAGLVTVTEAGAVIYYSLRRQRIEDATAELREFLVR